MKVLVVEDTRMYQKLIQAVLDDLKIDADYVEDGQSALAALAGGDYDMLCLDLHLPDMDGLDICRRLRAEPRTALLPVILLTADESETTLRDGMAAGITEVLQKSDFADLHHALKQLVLRMRSEVQGRVLYVEDSTTTAQLTLHQLHSMGLRVDHFTQADTAWEQFQSCDYDIVITDIVVEGTLSGVGLLRNIRAIGDPRGGIPVLAVSGLDDTARRIEILRQGANDYIAKPVIEEELRARVTNLITAKQLFDQVRAQQQKLEQLAVTDQLTGLNNRHYLHEAAHKAIANAYRYQHPLSLLMLDLDHFKAINDGHGHDVGDEVLREVGTVLRNNCRDGDIAARFGGEEFVLLLVECSHEHALVKAEQLRKNIAAARPADLEVTASIGVASLKLGEQDSFATLFKQADTAVYAAKHGGRNRVAEAP